MNATDAVPMGVTETLRAAVERALPWFDVKEARRSRATVTRVIRLADRVIDARTDDAKGGYRAYGHRAHR